MVQAASAPGKEISAVIFWIRLQILVWLFAPRPQFSDRSEKYRWFSFIQLFLVEGQNEDFQGFSMLELKPQVPHWTLRSIEIISTVLELLCHFLSIHSPPFQQSSLKTEEWVLLLTRFLWKSKDALVLCSQTEDCLPNASWQSLKDVCPNWDCTIKVMYSEFSVFYKYWTIF